MSVISTHNAGFFSCCSLKLNNIVDYINANLKIPDYVDSSAQFGWYKKSNNDITYDYFEHYNNITTVNVNYSIDYKQEHQYIAYSNLEYNKILPVVKKYFSPSVEIKNIITNMEKKYNIDYKNICVLFYRGNDKNSETKICSYDEYIAIAKHIMHKCPQIKFLLQSDETGFITQMRSVFPNNSICFNDEIRHMNKCGSTVDMCMNNDNHKYSKYYLAITIIMSKCKYVICGSGNCSMWIMFYRENDNNVYQNLNGKWIVNHTDTDWKFAANEWDKISNIAVGTHIRYGANNVGWIASINRHNHITVNNSHFNGDPAVGVKKVLQICSKCARR